MSAVVFVDTMFFAVIAPLLPRLAHELHLSKLSAGVMTASYPIGTLVGSLPGGMLAARAGPKATVVPGWLCSRDRQSPSRSCTTPQRWTAPGSSRAWAARSRGPAPLPGSSPRRRPSDAARSSAGRSPRRGLDHGLTAALTNLAWASGQILGSGAGGAVANAADDAVSMTIAAGLCLATLVLLLRPGAVRAVMASAR